MPFSYIFPASKLAKFGAFRDRFWMRPYVATKGFNILVVLNFLHPVVQCLCEICVASLIRLFSQFEDATRDGDYG